MKGHTLEREIYERADIDTTVVRVGLLWGGGVVTRDKIPGVSIRKFSAMGGDVLVLKVV